MLMTSRNWIFWGNQVTWADINISMVKLSLVSRRLVNSVLPFFGSYLWSATLTRIYDSPGHKGLCLTKQGAAMCHGDQWAPWRSCCSVVAGIPLLATVCVHLPEKWVADLANLAKWATKSVSICEVEGWQLIWLARALLISLAQHLLICTITSELMHLARAVTTCKKVGVYGVGMVPG